MITRFHIGSAMVVLLLYLGVAIWKYHPLNMTGELSTHSTGKNFSPDPFWTHFNRANEFLREGNYDMASAEYDQALEINSMHKDALYYAGSAHLMKRSFPEALDRWERLRRLEPNAPRTQLQLGTLHSCMDPKNSHLDFGVAETFIESAWSLNREETGAPLLLAKISLLEGDTSRVRSLLDNILSTDSSNSEARFISAFVEWTSGRTDRARQQLNLAILHQRELDNRILEGEGNTESGARAMLSEDRFCDKTEPLIRSLLHNSARMDSLFVIFDDQMDLWRDELKLRNSTSDPFRN